MLTLPYPPSTNRYWRNFRGRTVISSVARDYKSQVAYIASKHGTPMLTGKVMVDLWLHPKKPKGKYLPDRVRCIDLDNAMKIALDALQGILYADDAQVYCILASRGQPITDGGLTVIVESWEE
jgi:crossover junction endodeoxyribonuclease RusA